LEGFVVFELGVVDGDVDGGDEGFERCVGLIKGNVRNAGGLYDSYESQMTEALSNANGSADWDGTKFRF
jgi:hypothetical protein